MILHQFPDLRWLKKQAEENFANRQAWGGGTLPTGGWPSVILNTETQQTYRDNIRGPISFFTNLQGESEVSVGKRSARLRENLYFITNQDQHYTLEVNHTPGTEVFNVHFGEYWVDQAFDAIRKSPDNLLDETVFTRPFERIEFFNRISQRDVRLTQLLRELKETSHDRLAEEEKLFSLLLCLLQQDQRLKTAQLQLPVVKKSTRMEIMTRLLASTDYIYTHFHEDISLDTLARESCFSKFHFLRLFTLAFGKTPYQFVNQLRIERAKILLMNPTLDIKSIAKSLGFQDASSFSRLFYKTTNSYPTQFRRLDTRCWILDT